MKRFIAIVAVAFVASLFTVSDANAQVLRRNRGGGGNMGAGNGLCNMANCPIKPSQCVGGACNLQQTATAPAAPQAPAPSASTGRFDDGSLSYVPRTRDRDRQVADRGGKGRHSFDYSPPTAPSNTVAAK